MITVGIHACVFVGVAALTSACNQRDPMTEEGSGDSGGSSSDAGQELPGSDYFPLRDGASWRYRHVSSDGVTWDEVTRIRAVTWQGGPAFETADEPGLDGESTIATLVQRDTQILRAHKDVMTGDTLLSAVDYDPGFLRFDNAWTAGGKTFWTYDRTERDADGALVDTSVRYQVFTIESVDVTVEVPAGTFTCVQFLRERAESEGSGRFWFAPGVGKVKEESPGTGAIEELVEYTIP